MIEALVVIVGGYLILEKAIELARDGLEHRKYSRKHQNQ
jgi:hypothetical protein